MPTKKIKPKKKAKKQEVLPKGIYQVLVRCRNCNPKAYKTNLKKV